MSQGIEVVGLYVRDQDEALAFYVDKLGFRIHTDVRNGDYRWLTVQHPDQPWTPAFATRRATGGR
jgi:catechol 2,3-dioxygenase-like lactoylglutathione lyase family enzyme